MKHRIVVTDRRVADEIERRSVQASRCYLAVKPWNWLLLLLLLLLSAPCNAPVVHRMMDYSSS